MNSNPIEIHYLVVDDFDDLLDLHVHDLFLFHFHQYYSFLHLQRHLERESKRRLIRQRY